jgi:hypothetical protein
MGDTTICCLGKESNAIGGTDKAISCPAAIVRAVPETRSNRTKSVSSAIRTSSRVMGLRNVSGHGTRQTETERVDHQCGFRTPHRQHARSRWNAVVERDRQTSATPGDHGVGVDQRYAKDAGRCLSGLLEQRDTVLWRVRALAECASHVARSPRSGQPCLAIGWREIVRRADLGSKRC